MRKAFNFYRSYWEVAQELNDKDRLAFYDALLKKQFTGVENELNGMAKFAFISQKHSIDQQIKGYLDKTKDVLTYPTEGGAKGGAKGGIEGPLPQEKEKEKENILLSFNIFWNIYDKKLDRAKCLKTWSKIHPHKHELIYEQARKYVKSTPDSKYRKNPIRWLNGQCWEDEIQTETKTEIFDPLVEYCKRLGIQ